MAKCSKMKNLLVKTDEELKKWSHEFVIKFLNYSDSKVTKITSLFESVTLNH